MNTKDVRTIKNKRYIKSKNVVIGNCPYCNIVSTLQDINTKFKECISCGYTVNWETGSCENCPD